MDVIDRYAQASARAPRPAAGRRHGAMNERFTDTRMNRGTVQL